MGDRPLLFSFPMHPIGYIRLVLDADQRGRLTGRRAGGSFPASPRRGRLHDDAERDDEQPIAAELFSIERLEQHARTLAAAQHVRPASSRGLARPRSAQ